MPEFTFEEILSAFPCMAEAPPSGWQASGASIDSRSVASRNLFFAIEGENHDGHDFLEDAVAAGAAGLVIRYEKKGECAARLATFPRSVAIFTVSDPVTALQKLAKFHRSRLSGTVIGVTGSSGKTSTKELLYGLVKGAGKTVHATKGNLNNHIGLPLTLLSCKSDAEYVILEMGMNHPGEISLLSSLASPDHAIITSVHAAHIEFFSGIEAIAHAKLEILDGMTEGGTLVYCASSPCVSVAETLCIEKKVRPLFYSLAGDGAGTVSVRCASRFSVGTEGIRFTFEERDYTNSHYFSPVMAENLLGALLLLEAAGIEPELLAKASPALRPLTPGRFELFRKQGDPARVLVDDSYNANPDSFQMAIVSLRSIVPEGKLLLLAGEMAELGDHAKEGHRLVGAAAAEQRFDRVIAVGGENGKTLIDEYRKDYPEGDGVLLATADELLPDLAGIVAEMDGILVKGSRKARMDVISKAIKDSGYV